MIQEAPGSQDRLTNMDNRDNMVSPDMDNQAMGDPVLIKWDREVSNWLKCIYMSIVRLVAR